MRISHEAIYQALFVQGCGALRRELTACLRTGRTLRTPRARVGMRGKTFVSNDIMISRRPAKADDRAVPGHWEGDLIPASAARRSAHWSSARHASRCCCTCRAWRDMVPGPASRMGRRWRDTVPRQYATRSRILSPPCPKNCAARSPGISAQRWRNMPASRSIPAFRSTSAIRKALAARQQRKHQRAAAPVLPQGHRPQRPPPRCDRCRRSHPQRPPPQNTRPEDTRRGA